MTKAEITQAVKFLIAEDKLKKALKALSSYVQGIDDDLGNDLLLQTSTFNRNEKDRRNGLINKEDYDRTISRLNHNLTQIIDKLPKKGNDVEIPKPEADESVSPTPKASSEKRKILFLAANPTEGTQLNLGKELREIKDELAKGSQRDKFELKSESAVRVPTITRAMMTEEPQIVHFSGHGYGESGLVVEDSIGNAKPFPTKNIDELFELFKENVSCVLLNACYSKEQAEVISKHGIHVVGMNNAIGDRAAIAFAIGFYQSLGEGKNYEFAFKIARINITDDIKQIDIPELWYNGEKLNI